MAQSSPAVPQPDNLCDLGADHNSFDSISEQLYGERDTIEKRECFAGLSGSLRLSATKKAYRCTPYAFKLLGPNNEHILQRHKWNQRKAS